MRRRLLISSVLAAGVPAAVLAFATTRGGLPTAALVEPMPPPSPAAWPAYPTFPRDSCWTRPSGEGVLRSAPSYVGRAGEGLTPAALARAVLRRFGDRRYVRRIEIGAPPPIALQHVRGYFAGERPPANARWAYIAAPAATARLGEGATPNRIGDQMLAQWEADLVAGALRDDFCEAGGAPLVGWTIGRGGTRVSDRAQALGQRFPNPTPAAFRERVAAIGRRYGFRVVELRLLRPRELAPLLVVETDRDRKAFVADLAEIVSLLNPSSSAGDLAAITFEGLFVEVRDRDGPFVRTMTVRRGEVMGGQWAWDPCALPYASRGLSTCR